jgi:autotransporter-associated beta strand protein
MSRSGLIRKRGPAERFSDRRHRFDITVSYAGKDVVRYGDDCTSVNCRDDGKLGMFSRTAVTALLAASIVMLAAGSAWAVCTPASPVNNAAVTCTGATADQNGIDGYGSATDTGNVITVEAGASVTATGGRGLVFDTGSVANHGSIVSPNNDGIRGGNSLPLTNYGSITGLQGVVTDRPGAATIVNYGLIDGIVRGVRTLGADNLVINHGTIRLSGAGFAAVTTVGTFINYGEVDGGPGGGSNSGAFGARGLTNYGVIRGQESGASTQLNSSVIIANFGTITAVGNAIRSPGNVLNAGTVMGNHAGLLVDGHSALPQRTENSGTISGGTYGIEAVTFSNLAINLALANSGAISGGNTGIRIQGNLTATNSGTIAGGSYGIQHVPFGVFVNPHLNITNSGTISGSVAAIEFLGGGNTLTLAPGSIINGLVQATAGGNTFQLGGSGAGTFDISTLGDTAQYRRFATFNKVESSVWTLTGVASYGGDVNVNGGTLLVNGSLASASTMFVNAGATLGGSGTLPSTILGGGATLAAGNSVGTLTVQGDLAFDAAATYLVEVDSTGSDRTNVVGSATLGGATVTASFTGSSIANRYTILRAANGLIGLRHADGQRAVRLHIQPQL